MASLYQRIKELEAFKEEVLSGAYPQRSMLGPGAISSQFLRTKSITSSMLDVSELSSVAANTGALTVTGDLIAGSGANTLGYSPTNGLYLGNATPGSAPFRVASDGTMVATAATLTGTVTANTLTANNAGSIAGWTIDSAKLSQGNTGIGNSGVYRFWSGNLGSPSLSNFSVDSSGNVLAAGGTIAGMSVDSAKMTVGNAGVGSSGGYNFWSGNSTPSSAPFRVSTAGALTASSSTITGAVTATSGSFTGSITTSNIDANGGTMAGLTIDGTLTIGTGGSIAWNSGSSITSTVMTLKASGTVGFTMKDSGGTTRGTVEADASGMYVYGNGSFLAVGRSGATSKMSFTSNGIESAGKFYPGNGTSSAQLSHTIEGTSAQIRANLSDTSGASEFVVRSSTPATVFGVASNGAVKILANATTGIATGYTTLGSLTGRWAIYNDSGTLVGYIPVYATIT